MIPPITNHIDQALGKLIDRYKRKPRFAAWVASHIRQIQLLEDAAQVVLTSRDVDTCSEVVLGVLGKVVGQSRIGTLEQFRLYVKARIAVNRSRGNIPDIIKIARTLLGRVEYHEPGVAYFEIHALDPIEVELADVSAQLLREAKSAGVGMNLLYSDTVADEMFSFSLTDQETTDGATKGFALTAEGAGGQFALAF